MGAVGKPVIRRKTTGKPVTAVLPSDRDFGHANDTACLLVCALAAAAVTARHHQQYKRFVVYALQ
jgi:hypothetical protein